MSNRRPRFLTILLALGLLVGREAGAQDEVEALLRELRGLAGGQEVDATALVMGERRRVAEASHLPFRGPVRGEWITREQAVAHIEGLLDEQLPPRRARALEAAWKGLGLLRPGQDLREEILKLYGNQASGFYDPKRRVMYLLKDMPASLQIPVVRHELVHALQDQHWGIATWLGDAAEDEDRAAAAQALLEGHATEVMNRTVFLAEALAEEGGVPSRAVAEQELAEALDGLDVGALTAGAAESLGRDVLEEVQRAVLPADTPPVLLAQLLFPYTTGAAWVASYRASHPEDPGCEALYRRPPRSSAEVIDPRRWQRAFVPALQEPGAFLPGWELEMDSATGQLIGHILLTGQGNANGGDPEAGRWGRRDPDRNAPPGGGWQGDRVAVYHPSDDSPGTDVPGSLAVVWVSIWRDAREAQAVAESVRMRGRPDAISVNGPRVEAVLRAGGGDVAAMARAIASWPARDGTGVAVPPSSPSTRARRIAP